MTARWPQGEQDPVASAAVAAEQARAQAAEAQEAAARTQAEADEVVARAQDVDTEEARAAAAEAQEAADRAAAVSAEATARAADVDAEQTRAQAAEAAEAARATAAEAAKQDAATAATDVELAALRDSLLDADGLVLPDLIPHEPIAEQVANLGINVQRYQTVNMAASGWQPIFAAQIACVVRGVAFLPLTGFNANSAVNYWNLHLAVSGFDVGNPFSGYPTNFGEIAARSQQVSANAFVQNQLWGFGSMPWDESKTTMQPGDVLGVWWEKVGTPGNGPTGIWSVHAEPVPVVV
jgi:hypothetical protein